MRADDAESGRSPAWWPETSEAEAFIVPEAGTDVWHVDLRGGVGTSARHLLVLSAEEKTRAGKFHFASDANRFICAHGALREILARYVRQPAKEVEISATPSGKPFLSGAGASTGVRFNLAHSGDIALIAISLGMDVGIDVEKINPALDLESIARRCFTPGERTCLASVPPSILVDRFFSIWTRKEAYLKGRGDGLLGPLTEIDVSSSPARPDPAWVVRDVPVPPDYRGAVALNGGRGPCRSFRYEERTP
jgi:4'-phosphopantetheinyl transferase